MTTNFDEKKSKIERLLDRAISSLERTHPEQTSDAMGDYVKVLRLLSPISNDYRVKPITVALRRLYIYPNRPEHNEMLLELHDLKETLQEHRVNSVLTRKETSKIARKSLGDASKPRTWPWLIISAIAIFVILR
jgi:hypothetical protein